MSDITERQLASLALSPQPPSNLTTPTFHPFPHLPFELRLKIYSYALSTPRNLTITCHRPPFKRGQPRIAQSFKSNYPPPALLHVCHESRLEALNTYKPHFKTAKVTIEENFTQEVFVSARSCIYVSWDQDTLEFEETLLAYLAETELQAIQRLKLQVRDAAYFGHFYMDTLKRMKSLKELDIWAQNPSDAPGWSRPERYISTLAAELEAARELNFWWEVPNVRIFNGETGILDREIEGGVRNEDVIEG